MEITQIFYRGNREQLSGRIIRYILGFHYIPLNKEESARFLDNGPLKGSYQRYLGTYKLALSSSHMSCPVMASSLQSPYDYCLQSECQHCCIWHILQCHLNREKHTGKHT